MKKLLAIALTLMLLMSLAACGQQPAAAPSATEPAQPAEPDAVEPEATDKLVIYTSFTDKQLELVYDFEEQYGITVEVITGGTMELLSRAEAEQNSPYADVIIGGSKTLYTGFLDIFDEYVTPNNEFLDENHKVEYNKLTPYVADCTMIIYNTDIIGDVEITGWGSLLNPELKGRIAMTDPAASSSGASACAVMLWGMGDHADYFSDESIDFMTKFCEQLDGKLASGSSACHKSCADGEYAVAVTFNSAAYTYVDEGAPIGVCFPEEGTSTFSDVGVIVKGCPNLANARLFIDYMTSKEVQSRLGTEIFSIPVRSDADLPSYMLTADKITDCGEDAQLRSDNLEKITETFNDIFTSVS